MDAAYNMLEKIVQGRLLVWIAAAAVAPLLFPGLGCACAHDAADETTGGGGTCDHCPAPSKDRGPEPQPVEKCCCVEAHQKLGVEPEGWTPISLQTAAVAPEPPPPVNRAEPVRAPLRIAPRDSPPPLYLLTCALLL